MYRDNLAFIHHRSFGESTRAVAPELLRLLRAHGLRDGHVVDLGCGDGAWLKALTGAGFAATGIEQSAAFVRLARRAAPRQASDTPPCIASPCRAVPRSPRSAKS